MQSNKVHALDWLTRRGITRAVLSLFDITWYQHPTIGGCIKIPISDTHNKYRRDPLDERKPKYLYDRGGKVTLYGADKLSGKEEEIVVTEGELDTLVLWSMNIPAVSSTAGAMSFKKEWQDILPPQAQYYICFDNDDAGAEGALRTLDVLGPQSRVILIPETPGVKDISDFVGRGGDFRALMRSSLAYPDVATVEADKDRRQAEWLSTRFHQAYLDKAREQVNRMSTPRKIRHSDDEVLRAKSYPMTELHQFNRDGKALCPFHKEKTPSLQYYPHDNHAYCFGCGKVVDSIDLYRHYHPKATFREVLKALQ